ncbi:hypothetical protein Taro_020462 [Colocasia esculenta]|uniref:Protein kinase domain-containing protein n=1 Tax=Colocasia esculenta TaxID=4460 RepID=A0A843V2F3_COLES|nr:hypothetical protein [Colocasia esculenta]
MSRRRSRPRLQPSCESSPVSNTYGWIMRINAISCTSPVQVMQMQGGFVVVSDSISSDSNVVSVSILMEFTTSFVLCFSVSALNVMYSSLNSPSQLTGWTSNGGDPCGQNWKGVKCSGSSVTEIKLSGLGLTGSMGYQLSSLTSVTYFDLSKNNLQGDIPYQLPPNATHIDLSGNSFTGGVPYSLSQMIDIQYLNLANNQLNGQLNDMFGKVPKLSMMHLQNNQFTGSIDVLATLPLKDLNVENNKFTGWIPDELKNIDNLQTEGNSWSSGPAPPGHSSADGGAKKSSKSGESGVSGGATVGIVVAASVLVLVIFVVVKRRKSASYDVDDEKFVQSKPVTPSVSHEFKDSLLTRTQYLSDLKPIQSSIDMEPVHASPPVALKLPPPDQQKPFNEEEVVSKFNPKRNTGPIVATVYSLVDLQTATGSFSASRLLGEGSTGKVYKAKYADGKVLAVKKIDSSSLQKSRSEDFQTLVSGITLLHHPNITELVGYCSEPRQHLLVYEFQRNGSLHNFLHLADDYSNPLTWGTRIKIALGTARAVEYLHETCSPSIIHKNIKSANILLDAELNPHLTDCGLSLLYQDTDKSLGPGYIAPECTNPSAYTLKSDVYSFGVVMLELLTGRMPFDSSKPRSERSLVRWATPQLHDIDALAKMVDPALRGLYPPKSLSRFADVIALCIQPEPEFRPSMSEVVQALVRCVQRPSFNKKGGDMGASSGQSDDSAEYQYY